MAEKKVDIVVVGSLMIDLVSVTERIPKLGETIHGKSFVQNFGGKGANQCVAAQRLGASTAMVGKIGDDSFGNEYRKEFASFGNVNIDHLKQAKGTRTGIASIWVDSKGHNSIIITANANQKMTADDVRQAEHLIKDAKVIICQLEIPHEASLETLKLAKKFNVKSIFNPAPATKEMPHEFLRHADVICPNETEAELLCGFPVESPESCQKAVDVMLDQGARCVVITLGERGAAFGTREHRKVTMVSSEKVAVVDSTGAGDAFVGALAYFMAVNPTDALESSVRRACKYATASVQKFGTQPSFPAAKDLPKDFFRL